ncbi:MAG: long-chain fatty acid--CoA ligase [Firmicutes bacterium]|nr:long-chain fatty acid--CoA ligase [Bacillota bacterium]
MISAEKPWLKYYGQVPHEVDFPRCTMYETLLRAAERYPRRIAYDFMDYTATYSQFIEQIDRCADALTALGLREGDRMTISAPTSPPGIICFYALNKLGAVASMIHPLSTESEIEFYLKVSRSRFALTMDLFYDTFKKAADKTALELLLIARIQDYLPPLKQLLYWLAKGRKIPRIPTGAAVKLWKDAVMRRRYPRAPRGRAGPDDLAAILYSGGTTGTPKGIMLSNYNFVSQGMMCAEWVGMDDDLADILAMLPIFHGFGLGVCVNAALMNGGKSILVPLFEADMAADLIKKKPNYIIGVPTLFEALNRNEKFNRADLSCLNACFSGADTLPRTVKERFEEIVRRQGGQTKLLEGYGLTEAVTAIMALPLGEYREGSIGIPFPNMLAKIVKRGSTAEAEIGEEGEICVHGPAVMLGYLDQPEETANVLKRHDDGKTWLHTGDIGTMDQDGFFYFKLREKRMIKSSGMNVYPTQVEEQLYKHPAVAEACVIGVPDEVQVERVKAFVVLKDEARRGPEMEQELIEHCRRDLIKWSCPREIAFYDELPKTRVGKIAYKELENQEIARLKKAGGYTGDQAG